MNQGATQPLVRLLKVPCLQLVGHQVPLTDGARGWTRALSPCWQAGWNCERFAQPSHAANSLFDNRSNHLSGGSSKHLQRVEVRYAGMGCVEKWFFACTVTCRVLKLGVP